MWPGPRHRPGRWRAQPGASGAPLRPRRGTCRRRLVRRRRRSARRRPAPGRARRPRSSAGRAGGCRHGRAAGRRRAWPGRVRAGARAARRAPRSPGPCAACRAGSSGLRRRSASAAVTVSSAVPSLVGLNVLASCGSATAKSATPPTAPAPSAAVLRAAVCCPPTSSKPPHWSRGRQVASGSCKIRLRSGRRNSAARGGAHVNVVRPSGLEVDGDHDVAVCRSDVGAIRHRRSWVLRRIDRGDELGRRVIRRWHRHVIGELELTVRLSCGRDRGRRWRDRRWWTHEPGVFVGLLEEEDGIVPLGVAGRSGGAGRVEAAPGCGVAPMPRPVDPVVAVVAASDDLERKSGACRRPSAWSNQRRSSECRG